MKKRLLIIGAAGVRLNLGCERLPYAGETAEGIKYAYAPDCLAAASAVAAVGMGTETVLLARVGPDANGTKLISLLSEKGVDTRFCVKDRRAATSLTVVITEDAADKRMIRYRGASLNLTASDVEEAFNSYPDAVLLRLESSAEAAKAAAGFALEKDVPLFVAVSGAERAEDAPLPKSAHTLITDARTMLTLTDIAPSNADAALRSTLELCRRIEVENVIFRMNNNCIYVYDGRFGRILDKTSKGHNFTDVYAPAFVSEFMKCGNVYAASKFALAATSLWEACGEDFASVPTATEVRRDAGN